MHKISYISAAFLLCLGMMQGCAKAYLGIDALAHPLFSPICFSETTPFLKGQHRHTDADQILWVMIEGDGRAWKSASLPSSNPTPSDPVGWRLASSIRADNVLYLSRPCQYLSEMELKHCTVSDWTDGRFSQKWVETMNDAISQIKRHYGYRDIVLAGYSGGGVMAALIATRRTDVRLLISVASPLNVDAWSRYHHVSLLSQSFDPQKEREALQNIPQIHIVGKNDRVVPLSLVQAFINGYPNKQQVLLLEVEAEHSMQLPLDFVEVRRSFLNAIDAQDNPL